MPWDIIGHDWAVHLLQQHIARGAVRHAYLFTGPPGVGRRTLALRFAQAVNCQKPPAPGEACGQCRVCRQIASGQQPDLAVVQNAQEGAQLSVETIRELQSSLSLSPYEARYRVAILRRFEEATAGAQNALLKTLEEAPPRVILLLTAASAESLLPTIVSRCEVLRLRPLALDEVEPSLAARGLPPEQVSLLAHISGGRPGYAVQLSANPTLLEQRTELLDDLWELLRAPLRERFAYVEKKTKSGKNTREERDQIRDNLRTTMLTWLSFWRDVLLRCAGSGVPLSNIDRMEQIDRLAGEMELSAITRRVSDLENSLTRLNSANLTLLVETLLLDWPRLRY